VGKAFSWAPMATYRAHWLSRARLLIHLPLAQVPVIEKGSKRACFGTSYINHDIRPADVAMQDSCFLPSLLMCCAVVHQVRSSIEKMVEQQTKQGSEHKQDELIKVMELL
jgi:hypothetical protein